MSAGDRPKAAPVDDRRYVLPLLTNVGVASLLPRRRRRRGIAKAARREFTSAIRVDQGTKFLSRDLKSVDVSALCHLRPRPTESAFIEASNGPLPTGMSQRPLVPEPCRRAKKKWTIGASAATKCAQRPKAAARLCYSIAAARPARRREQTRKTLASGTIYYLRDSLVTP